MELGEHISLRMRDIDRLKVIQHVLDGRLKARQAAQQLDVSRRQVIRLKQRVVRHGNRGIVHGLRGRPSNRRLPILRLREALAILRQPLFEGFGPTLAAEKLAEQGFGLSVTSLRRAMLGAGLWRARHPQSRHRQWRPRRDCLGELVQLDGSDHAWFEGRGPRCVLIAYIDDATSRILYAEFVDVEDTWTLLRTTRTYLQRQGRPLAFYVDKDSIYKVNRQASIEEDLRDQGPISQFTRAMTDLGIQVISANSPQAKGRVERLFNTLQDRLVKELRLHDIPDKTTANRFLWSVYIPRHNAQFAVVPANTTNAHRSVLPSQHLSRILTVRTERTLANDFTIRFQNRYFQLLPQPGIRPGHILHVEQRLDGSFHLLLKKRELRFKTIPKPPARPPALSKPRPPATSRTNVPGLDHPWRRFHLRKTDVQPASLNFLLQYEKKQTTSAFKVCDISTER